MTIEKELTQIEASLLIKSSSANQRAKAVSSSMYRPSKEDLATLVNDSHWIVRRALLEKHNITFSQEQMLRFINDSEKTVRYEALFRKEIDNEVLKDEILKHRSLTEVALAEAKICFSKEQKIKTIKSTISGAVTSLLLEQDKECGVFEMSILKEILTDWLDVFSQRKGAEILYRNSVLYSLLAHKNFKPTEALIVCLEGAELNEAANWLIQERKAGWIATAQAEKLTEKFNPTKKKVNVL